MPPAFAGGFWKITAAQRQLMLTPPREVESTQETKKPPVRRYSMAELRDIDARHATPAPPSEETSEDVTSP